MENNYINVRYEPKSEPKKMGILYAASECQPFVATGGLADVMGSLPKTIAKLDPNADIRVILPKYGSLSETYVQQLKFVGHFTVSLSWRKEYCGIFKYKAGRVTYYFVDNERYFKRDKIYGYDDDGERFAFFSKAVLQALPFLNFRPDIIHCSDWHTALIPIYLKTIYDTDDFYRHMKTVFTIHNIEYQGKFDSFALGDLFGIPKSFYPIVEQDKCINLLKGAIELSDIVTTVSPTYATEIKQPLASQGLHPVINKNEHKMRGIINGLDYSFYNPGTDAHIYLKYTPSTFANKRKNKRALQAEVGLEQNEQIPIFCMATRLVKHKGLDLIESVLENCMQKNMQFCIVGDGDKQYINFFNAMHAKYPTKICAKVGMYSNIWARKYYAGADVLLMPSLNEPCGLSQMIASRYGTIPLVREVGGLKDSVTDFGCAGGGNGYTFEKYNADDLLYSIERAIADFADKKQWKEKITIVMNKDFSWANSGKKYIALYREMNNAA